MNRREDQRFAAVSAGLGDQGDCIFFVTQTDELIAPFSSTISRRIESLMTSLLRRTNGTRVGELESRWYVQQQVEWARKQSEVRRRGMAINAVEDDQRKQVYHKRDEFWIRERSEVLSELIDAYVEEQLADNPRAEMVVDRLAKVTTSTLSAQQLDRTSSDSWRVVLAEEIKAGWMRQVATYGIAVMEEALLQVLLMVLDSVWRDNMSALDRLFAAYYKTSPTGEASKSGLRVGASREFEQMWRTFRERAIAGVLSLELEVS